jgi:hypothetical protein
MMAYGDQGAQVSRIVKAVTLAFLILGIGLSVVYLSNRYSVARTLENGDWAYGTPAKSYNVPATTCTVRYSDFTESYVAVAYFNGTAYRLDSQVDTNTGSYTMHSVTSDGITSHVWKSGETQGQIVPTQELGAPLAQQSTANIQCAPWWFPDDSIFTIPTTVTFPATSQ